MMERLVDWLRRKGSSEKKKTQLDGSIENTMQMYL